ncbi:MAG: hypothetical protein EOO15_08315 [Chitinophagaceae bacterium]|nr:MAG: hypothetical protein EOO15_08315 [Chitinophagaceae bacterium]
MIRSKMQAPGHTNRSALRILIAPGVNLLLFGAALLLLHPVYGTVEDVFVLYQLSGGFGNPPTELLHYNHILNPLLGFLLKTLFKAAPSVNWYTLALLSAHFMAGSVMLACLLRRYTVAWALLFYGCFFFVFEYRLLDAINFSNTSLLLALGGLVLFFSEGQKETPRKGKFVFALCLLISASLFRIHSWLPLLPVLVPFALLLPTWARRMQVMVWIGAALLGTLLLHRFQERHYTRNLPAWRAEETYRHQVYAFYNHHNVRYPSAGQPLHLEGSMLRHGLMVDRSLLSEPVMQSLFASASSAPGANAWPVNRWFLINNKLYLLVFALLFLVPARMKEKILWSAAILVGAAIWLALILYFAKMPDYLLHGLIAAVMMTSLATRSRAALPIWLPPVFLLFAAWGLWLQLKLDSSQRTRSARFEEDYRAISAAPHTLFFLSTEHFPLQDMPVWTVPVQYPLLNFLSGEHALQGLDASVLRRFGIRSVRDLPAHQQVLFGGWQPSLLQDYYQRTNGIFYEAVADSSSGKSLHAYRLIPKTDR